MMPIVEKDGNTMTHLSLKLALAAFCAALICIGANAADSDQASGQNINQQYPGLANGCLFLAKTGPLPDGVILRAGEIEIKAADLEAEMEKTPAHIKSELKKNAFFMLEQMANEKLLLQEAKTWAASPAGAQTAPAKGKDRDLIQAFLKDLLKDVKVADEEVSKFYAENKEMCGGASLDKVNGQIREYLAGLARQEAANAHIRNMGKIASIVVMAAWVAEQAKLAKDNPVDKARDSGLPSMVDFGADGCRPCDMMTPVLADLKKKYEGKLNVVFVHAKENTILSARYGINGIPVQVFFDKDGKETFRHTGFFPMDEIEKKLADMGVAELEKKPAADKE